MRGRTPLFAGLAVIVFMALVVGIGMLLNQPAKLTVSHVVNAKDVFASAARYSDSEALVSSPEEGILAYDLRTGDEQLIAPAAEISSPDSLAISDNKQHVLFHTNFIRSNTSLAMILAQKGLQRDSDYWWLYTTSTNTYLPLPEGTLVAKFHNDTVITLRATPNGEDLTIYDLLGNIQDTAAVANISNFYPTPGGYLLLSTTNELLSTQSGVVSKKVADATTIVGGTKSELVITQNSGKTQKLVSVKLSDYSVKTLAENISGKQAWLGSGVILYGALKGSVSELHSYNLTTNKDSLWQISDDNTTYTDLAPVTLFSNSTALVQTPDNKYLLVSANSLRATANWLFN